LPVNLLFWYSGYSVVAFVIRVHLLKKVCRLSRYDLGTAMPAGEGVQADGIVKWFNGSKGFGFVAINSNSSDAFLHISVVTRAGMQSIAENTRLRCMVVPSERGMQVTHILEVMGVDHNAPQPSVGHDDSHKRDRNNFEARDSRSDFGRSDFSDRGEHRRNDFSGGFGDNRSSPSQTSSSQASRQPSGPEVEVVGSMKWYKTDKGFGFAMPDDGGKDIFVHRSVLERAGLDTIAEGRKVRMMVTTSQKGREASRIDLLD
jgi:cold shock protein